MSTLRYGASPSDKARKLVAELVEVSDKYHNGTHAKSWQIWAVNEIANALAAAPSLHKEGAGGAAEHDKWLREMLIERVKRLAKYPYGTWDGGETTSDYQSCVGQEDVLDVIANYAPFAAAASPAGRAEPTTATEIMLREYQEQTVDRAARQIANLLIGSDLVRSDQAQKAFDLILSVLGAGRAEQATKDGE